jgi:NAD(P)-dependent dehydrogenase (short-subunit alcohol dehydrogenase family)
MRSSSQENIQGRFVLVTGGSSGIGFALSAKLLALGAKVFIVGLHAEGVELALGHLGGRGQNLNGLACDVSLPDSVEQMAGIVLREQGVPDVIVNNAGFATYRTFEQSDADEVERLIAVNFGGAIRVTKAFVAAMIQRRSGQVVNVASIAGALKLTPNGLYCGSKHGMLAWSRCLDLELKRFGISVSVVCPGRVETPFFDHETFRARRHRKETELSVPIAQVVDAIVETIVRRRSVRFVPRYFGLLAWLADTLGPLVQNRLDRLMLSRIEDLYRESEVPARAPPLRAKNEASR